MTEEKEQLWGMIYVCAASQKFTFEEMSEIPKEFKNKFLARGIGGLIIFAEGNVLCFMEGPKSSVYEQFNEVIKDDRHKNLVKFFDNSLPYYYFEDFGLAFYFMDSALKPLSDFNTEGKRLYLEECLQMDDMAMKRISQFIKNNSIDIY